MWCGLCGLCGLRRAKHVASSRKTRCLPFPSTTNFQQHPIMDDQIPETQDIALETPADDVFRAPSVKMAEIFKGASYSHFSPIPKTIANDLTTECVLGVDEAGRGPVLGKQTRIA